MDDPCDTIGKIPDPLPPTATFTVTVENQNSISVSPDSHGTFNAIGDQKKFYVTLDANGFKAAFASDPVSFDGDAKNADLVACRVSDSLVVILDTPLVKEKNSISMLINVDVSSEGRAHVVSVDPKIINQPHGGGGSPPAR
ncbi:MAG: hypothetical protein AAFY88_07625 [Acidobacteriota bacterium]